MNPISSSICSTTRAAAIPCAFSSLWMRAGLPALCGGLALMLAGSWVGVHAQTAHFVRAQSATASAANNNPGSPRAEAAGGRTMEITSSNGNFGTVNVGSTSPTPVSMVFTFDTAGTLGSTTAVTQGATGLDFTDAGTGTCKAGTAYGAGAACTVDVNFSPKFSGPRYGAAELLDGSGNVLAAGYLQGTGMGPQVNFQPGTQSVITDSTQVAFPAGIAADGNGNIYISDSGRFQVLKETPSASGYTQSVVAKTPPNGDGGTAGVAVDGIGNLYLADSYNRQVLKETLSAGVYTQTVILDAASDGLIFPEDIAVDSIGNLYVSDNLNSRVLKETLSAGSYTQSVVADAASNGLFDPLGIVVDASGNVYIADADYSYSRVLKETPSASGYTQSVVADTATNGLYLPEGVAVDAVGNVYIADTFNYRVLKETLSAGGYTQSVVADHATNGPSFEPQELAVDGIGNLYIADIGDYLTLKVDLADAPSLPFAPTAVGASRRRIVTVSNGGNAPLTFPLPMTGDNPSVPANFAWDPSSTCEQTTEGSSAPFELAGGASCIMEFDFKPTTAGSIAGISELTDNNLNVPGSVQSILLSGTALQGAQAINFPQPASIYYGSAPVTLSATGGASGNPVIFSLVSGPGSLSGTNNSVLTVTGWGAIVIAANQAGSTDYTAAPQVTRSITALFSRQAYMTSPTPGSTLTGSSATFTWAPGIGPTEYMLYLGSTGVRSSNLYNSGAITGTSVNVTGLPTNGETIYARLYSLIGGDWHSYDYTFTAK